MHYFWELGWLQGHVCSPRCEVSERATHRSSPHGPCEPSARVTGRARTYATDLPKWDSMLPEAASERDHRSPHIHIVSPAILGSLLHPCHTDTTRTPRPTGSRRFPTMQRTGAPHTTRTSLLGIHQQYDQSPGAYNLPSFLFSDALLHQTDLPHA